MSALYTSTAGAAAVPVPEAKNRWAIHAPVLPAKT